MSAWSAAQPFDVPAPDVSRACLSGNYDDEFSPLLPFSVLESLLGLGE